MEYILRTNTVSKKYTNYYAVDKVSISIKKGEIYGLIGKNGAGKSTLMKMIAGLIEPSEGSIELQFLICQQLLMKFHTKMPKKCYWWKKLIIKIF